METKKLEEIEHILAIKLVVLPFITLPLKVVLKRKRVKLEKVDSKYY